MKQFFPGLVALNIPVTYRGCVFEGLLRVLAIKHLLSEKSATAIALAVRGFPVGNFVMAMREGPELYAAGWRKRDGVSDMYAEPNAHGAQSRHFSTVRRRKNAH